VITAYPGETYQIVKPDRPNPNFAPFEKAVLRNVAAAAGMASHQVTNDYSDANYSSMRAALLEAWKTIHRRRMNFGSGFAGPIRSAWLEEAMEVRDFPLPAGAPSFVECRQAYSSCRWLGPGRGWIDPVAEKEGAVLGMAAGLSTLETEASENGGEDWESIADQLVVEKRAYEVRGLDPPVKTAKGQGSPPADRDGAGQSAPAAKPKEG
jgi:capsid protein